MGWSAPQPSAGIEQRCDLLEEVQGVALGNSAFSGHLERGGQVLARRALPLVAGLHEVHVQPLQREVEDRVAGAERVVDVAVLQPWDDLLGSGFCDRPNARIVDHRSGRKFCGHRAFLHPADVRETAVGVGHLKGKLLVDVARQDHGVRKLRKAVDEPVAVGLVTVPFVDDAVARVG